MLVPSFDPKAEFAASIGLNRLLPRLCACTSTRTTGLIVDRERRPAVAIRVVLPAHIAAAGYDATFAFRVFVVRIEILPLSATRRRGLLLLRPLLAADVRSDRGRSPEPSACLRTSLSTFLIHEDDHPDTDSAAVAKQWRAMDPTRSTLPFALFVRFREPADLGRDAATLRKGEDKVRAHAG